MMQNETCCPVLGAHEFRQGFYCLLPWSTSKISSVCRPHLQQVLQQYCNCCQQVFSNNRDRYLQQKLYQWFNPHQLDRAKEYTIALLLLGAHRQCSEALDVIIITGRVLQGFDVPGEFLRVSLTQSLPHTDICSRGPVCSSQAELIQSNKIINLYWRYYYHFHCQNQNYQNFSAYRVIYRTEIKVVRHNFNNVKNEISAELFGSNAETLYVAAAARWPATRKLQAKRDLSRVLALALMRFDACPTINRATGPFVLAVSASKRQTILSLSPLLPLLQPHLPPVPLLASTVTTATTTKTTESHDRDDVAPKRSITALAEKSPFSDEKTFAAHSTAFKRSRRVERYSQPILFMLYLLALLLEMSGRHCAVAGVETTFNLSSKSLDNSKSGVVEEQHPYNEYIWELNQLNPWLSACDLAGPAPADLQGSCGPPEVPKNCPAPCKKLHERMDNLSLFDNVMKSLKYIGNTTLAHRKTQQKKSSNGEETTIAPEQCLFYLEESHKQDVCREDFGQASSWSFMSPRENRYWLMSGLRLRHCCEHAAVNALAPGKGGPFEAVLNGGDGCVKAMEKLLLVDALAARLHCEFEEVLARYDCGQSYSVIHNCTHCKEAYRQWVCSSLVPYFAHEGPLDLEPSDKSWTGRRLRPCRSLCQSVEQRCPYLLPGDRAPAYPTQYAGEPTFLCRDPNIPETGEQATRALHPNSEDECCFKICSEEKPALGICANCLGHIPKIGFKYRDPSVAPQCEIITSLSGQQQAQPTLQQLSLCGSGGIGSMIDNENSVFFDSSVSSLLSDLSSKTSLPITTNSVSASSSSASIVKSSSVPLLCFFSLCNLFFCSQYATNHLLGITNIMKYFESLCTSFIEIFKLFLIELLSILNYFLQDCSFNYLNNIHGHFHLMIQLNASFNFLTALILMTKNGIVIAERYVYQGYRCYYYYCYRWWLWPRRWKNFILHRYSLYRFCSIREYCCLWCYWCWLWPHRWKKKEFRIILNKDRIYLSLKSRKKRRRKMRFNAFCRKFDLVQSTS